MTFKDGQGGSIIIDKDTKTRVNDLQHQLTKELGFKPSQRQVIAYLIQYYLTQNPMEATDGK